MTSTTRKAGRGRRAPADHRLEQVESVARIGSYSTDLRAGRWVTSRGLDAILGIGAAFDRSVEGWASLIHPADREAMVAYLVDEVVGHGQPFDRRYRIVRADTGAERLVHGRGALEFDRSGRPVRMVGTIADITDQVAAETERALLEDGLRRSERNLAEAQRIAHIGSWEWDLASDTAQRSDELHRIFGAELGAIPATTEAFLAFVHPDDRARVRDSERAAISDGGRYALQYRAVRPDGSVRIIHDEAELIRDASGAPVRMVGTVQDITERLAAEEERTRLATAVEQTSDSVVITDLAGAIEYVNPAFELVSGHGREEVIGKNPRILQSGRQTAAYYRALWRRLIRGQTWRGNFINRRADGTLYHVEATISPRRASNGQVTGYIALERDITALHAARSRLATEFRERAQVAAALARLQPGPTAEATGTTICDELLGLPGIDLVAIFTLLDPGHGIVLASAGPENEALSPGRLLPIARATYFHERATQGPWAEAWQTRPEDGQYGQQIAALGLRASAYAPIRNGEGLLGVIAIGTTDDTYAQHLIEHLPVVSEFAATASALLSRDLEGGRRISRRRAEIAEIMHSRAFTPVYQPIVRIGGGAVVAYEALTRFTDGTRPDMRFAEAWTVDLGADLELATLEAAIASARDLPEGGWLNVNVSPRLLADPEPLRAVLAKADRPAGRRDHRARDRRRLSSTPGCDRAARRLGADSGRRRRGGDRQLRAHRRAAARLREARHQPGPGHRRRSRPPGDRRRDASLRADDRLRAHRRRGGNRGRGGQPGIPGRRVRAGLLVWPTGSGGRAHDRPCRLSLRDPLFMRRELAPRDRGGSLDVEPRFGRRVQTEVDHPIGGFGNLVPRNTNRLPDQVATLHDELGVVDLGHPADLVGADEHLPTDLNVLECDRRHPEAPFPAQAGRPGIPS